MSFEKFIPGKIYRISYGYLKEVVSDCTCIGSVDNESGSWVTLLYNNGTITKMFISKFKDDLWDLYSKSSDQLGMRVTILLIE